MLTTPPTSCGGEDSDSLVSSDFPADSSDVCIDSPLSASKLLANALIDSMIEVSGPSWCGDINYVDVDPLGGPCASINGCRIDAIRQCVSRNSGKAPVSYNPSVIGPESGFEPGSSSGAQSPPVTLSVGAATCFSAAATPPSILTTSLNRAPSRQGDPIGRTGHFAFREVCIVKHDILEGGPHWRDEPILRFNCHHPERIWQHDEENLLFRRQCMFSDVAAM